MTVVDDLRERLGVERGGVTLPAPVIKAVVKYLVESVGMEDARDLNDSEMKSTIEEAWAAEHDGGVIPSVYSKRVAKWLRPQDMSSARLVDGHGLEADLEDECDEANIFGLATPTAHDYTMLETDKRNQGLNGERLIVLSAALELGRVPSWSEVTQCKFGYKGDARLSQLAKDQKKASMMTLAKILESSTHARRDLQAHFGGLIRDFTERKCVIESSLISQFWSEAQSVSSDDAVLKEYLKEWFRKYPGRGIPETLDIVLATRVSGTRGSGGVSAEQLKELKDALKSNKSELAEVKRELTRLKQEVKAARPKPGEPREGEPKGRGPKCHHCGAYGHIARNCPEKAKEAEEADDDQEQ